MLPNLGDANRFAIGGRGVSRSRQKINLEWPDYICVHSLQAGGHRPAGTGVAMLAWCQSNKVFVV